jgi:hypothetical protein
MRMHDGDNNPIGRRMSDLTAELERLGRELKDGASIGRLLANLTDIEQADALAAWWDELGEGRIMQCAYIRGALKDEPGARRFIQELQEEIIEP